MSGSIILGDLSHSFRTKMTDMDMKDTPKITITPTPTEGFGAVKKYLNANRHCSDPSGSRNVRVLDESFDYVECLYCLCKTNARLRKCCLGGYRDDGGKLHKENK